MVEIDRQSQNVSTVLIDFDFSDHFRLILTKFWSISTSSIEFGLVEIDFALTIRITINLDWKDRNLAKRLI